MDEVWRLVREDLQARVSDNSFKIWIEPLMPLPTAGTGIALACPNRFFLNWVREHYLAEIKRSWERCGGAPGEIAKFCVLPPEVQEKMRMASYGEFQTMTEAGEFPRKVGQLIEEFGHLSDNGNDFSAVPWREQPETVLHIGDGFCTQRRRKEGRALRSESQRDT